MYIRGRANLVFQSRAVEVLVTVDIDNGIIRCYPTAPLDAAYKLIILTNNDVTIDNFHADVINGKLSAKRIDGITAIKFFGDDVKHHLYSRLLREFKFSEGFEPQEIIFKKLNSKIEFNFKPSRKFDDKTEVHFMNCWPKSDFEVSLGDYSCRVKADNSGHAICYINKSLSFEELEYFNSVFRTTYCLSQGSFPLLKEALSSNKLILNLIRNGLKKNPANFIFSENIKILFNKILSLFKSLNEDDLSKYKNSIYYFENGLNYDIHLEIRCISIFNAFEILDKSITLNKNSLKDSLNFNSLYDSSFLIKVRNELIHNGLSLKKAIKKIETNVNEKDKNNSELTNMFAASKHDKHIDIYFFMVNKLFRKLIDQCGYSEEFNSYG